MDRRLRRERESSGQAATGPCPWGNIERFAVNFQRSQSRRLHREVSFQLNPGQDKGVGIPNRKQYKYKGMIASGNMHRGDP